MAIVETITPVVPGKDFKKAVFVFPKAEAVWVPAGGGGDAVVFVKAGTQCEVPVPDSLGGVVAGAEIPLAAFVDQFHHHAIGEKVPYEFLDTAEEIACCSAMEIQEYQGKRKPEKLLSFSDVEAIMDFAKGQIAKSPKGPPMS